MHTTNYLFKKFFAILLLLMLAAVQADAAGTATGSAPAAGEKKTAAPFSFDSVWFYRDGTRVIPEIGKHWLTVVFEQSYDPGLIREKAKAIVNSHDSLIDYLYDRNLAEDACFFRMLDGVKLEDISRLISQLNQDESVKYVHPTLVLDNKTFAFFDIFQMEWKTGIDKAQRDALLGADHVVFNENENRYSVDVTAMPFFKALDLLAEDVRVLRVTPYLVEIKPSISANLSLLMTGGNIGDGIPFKLTIIFSDRVSIDPSSIATLNLRPSNLQKDLFDCTFDPYDYSKAVTKSPIVITGRMKFYAPGEFTIPAVTISYSCPSCFDGTVRSLDTKPVIFKVSSMIPTDKSDDRLIVPADPVDPDYRLAALHRQSLRYLWFAITCFAGLVLCAARLLFLRRKVTAERERVKERTRDDLLAEQLRVSLHAVPAAPHWSYLAEVGALLRDYLMVLYGIDSKYQGGSGRQFMETVRAHLPGECAEMLGNIFAAIDDSVSIESERYQDMDQLQLEILKVVDLTARRTEAQDNQP